MAELSLLLATVLSQGASVPPDEATLTPPPTQQADKSFWQSAPAPEIQKPFVQPESLPVNSFSQPLLKPRSGVQLYVQRIAALRSGRLYTRLPVGSFREVWQNASGQPSYEQWRRLLSQEAKAVARGQGNNRLAILLGDSLSLWFPTDRLPADHLWLNQSISGDTTRGILRRLDEFAGTRPDVIYLMAGVNDVKVGIPEAETQANLRKIVQRLRRTHPRARIVVQSILPTRVSRIPNPRIERINDYLQAIVRSSGTTYLDLYSHMLDYDGYLQRSYTTDGLHLNETGYLAWEEELRRTSQRLAQRSPVSPETINPRFENGRSTFQNAAG